MLGSTFGSTERWKGFLQFKVGGAGGGKGIRNIFVMGQTLCWALEINGCV